MMESSERNLARACAPSALVSVLCSTTMALRTRWL
jgi:hypothetical protein